MRGLVSKREEKFGRTMREKESATVNSSVMPMLVNLIDSVRLREEFLESLNLP